ncbi:BnaA02g12630D [Brassica napus]|uniref:BnaA02g12630D protein n=1 Tax=Brassica napus TaxID=3708 RepID=A0A078FE07_BRANA|nr:BnaA02g12630D [Brassica napus]
MRCLAHACNFVNEVFTITRCIIQDLHSNLAAITKGSSINNSKSSFPNHFRK